MNKQETERNKFERLARWNKYWRLAQVVAAIPDLMQRRAAVEKHSADYPWFGDMVKKVWRDRHENKVNVQRQSED